MNTEYYSVFVAFIHKTKKFHQNRKWRETNPETEMAHKLLKTQKIFKNVVSAENV